MSMNLSVRIVEVSPRDGLQNEKGVIPTAAKIDLIKQIVAAGAQEIEVGAFVHPKWTPQMADSLDVFAATKDLSGIRPIVLVPNMRGLERAIDAGVERIAIFPAATESFCQRNLNASKEDCMQQFAQVSREAIASGIAVRGYVSVAFHCPFEGWVKPNASLEMIESLLEFGCYEVSIADTTGHATPGHIEKVFAPAIKRFGAEKIVAHFHDTYNQGIANALWAWRHGVTSFDASAGGLGGCPYSPGAKGNISTEALVHMFTGLGVSTAYDLPKIIEATRKIEAHLGRSLESAFLSA